MTAKPTSLQVKSETIPQQLKDINQWVCWRLEQKPGRNKPTKPPYQANGQPAKVDDPSTWTTFDAVWNAYQGGGFSGIGFVMTDQDPFSGTDLDDCLNPDTGELDAVAAEIVSALTTYCEVSPSGKGLRLFSIGRLPQGGRRKGKIEMYDQGRFLTITGHRFNGHASINECTAEVARIHAKFLANPAKPRKASTPPPVEAISLDDSQLIKKARKARNGNAFNALWSGDLSAHGDDASAADLALCNMLAFWTGNDAEQIDRLFRQSGLMRDKWDESHYSDGRTYGQATIEKAIDDCKEGYGQRTKAGKFTPAPGSPWRQIDDDEPVTEFDRFHPDLMRKSGTSELLKNHYNAVLVVQNALPGLIGFNEFRQRIETRRLTPWGKEPGEWTETDTAELACLLAKPYASFSLNVLAPAVMTVAHRNKFNPANERLRELSEQWDKTPRLQTWLIDHFNAAHNPLNDAYLREIGEKWMVGVAARVLFPGCKRDDVLILRGQQGLMKSTAAAAIADCIQPDSFSDCLGDLSGKEARSAIRGLVVAELGELAALNKSDMESTKAFVAAKKDRFREAYGRGERDYLRTVSFIGTTNDPTFLKDPTGNRRWWPVTVERDIDMKRFNDVLPQLLGEAAHKAMAGEPWFVSDKTALQQADAVRRAHYDDDPLTDAILAAAKNRFEPITIAGLMSAIGLRVDQQTMANQKRIAGILRINGYRDVRKKINGSRASVWEPVPPYDFTYGGTVAHGGTAPASEATVPPYEESTVAPVKASKQAAVPPCHPRPPYFEKKVKEAEKEVKRAESGESLTNNLRFQGYIEKRVAHGGTVALTKTPPPVEASTPVKPAALKCSWNDTGRLITKCAKPEPTTDRTGCASCGAVKEGVAA